MKSHFYRGARAGGLCSYSPTLEGAGFFFFQIGLSQVMFREDPAQAGFVRIAPPLRVRAFYILENLTRPVDKPGFFLVNFRESYLRKNALVNFSRKCYGWQSNWVELRFIPMREESRGSKPFHRLR